VWRPVAGDLLTGGARGLEGIAVEEVLAKAGELAGL
jgi:hypothetical protein